MTVLLPFYAEDDDWNVITFKCKSLAAKWEQLSAFLGLPSALIDQIRHNHPNDSSGCWNEALSQWIKQNYSTEKFGKPSWKTLLCQAIEYVDRRLFEKLASEHKRHVTFVDRVLPFTSEGCSQVTQSVDEGEYIVKMYYHRILWILHCIICLSNICHACM